MLDRFTFIGTGGSGGRTLRMLQRDLRHRLESVGWTGPLPAAWQFLHIDVPVEPDVGDAGDEGDIRYLGLTLGGESYLRLDMQLANRSDAALRNYSTWRPDPPRCPPNPEHGAGQYRAVGRVLGATASQRIADELRRSTQASANADTDELAAASVALGDHEPGASRSWTIVVSSLGGGSGAGLYIDVCNLLRMLSDGGINNSIAFLYTPDIFSDIDTVAKRALAPNTLAAISELINSTWNSDAPEVGEFALFTTAGVQVPTDQTRRGPLHSFLVSRTNGQIGRAGGPVVLNTQGAVYRAVGSALGAIVSRKALQDELVAQTIGNWQHFGRPPDKTGLTSGETQPFNAIGYASLSLGRDRFLTYARNRLTGALARHLLQGHRHDPDQSNRDALIEVAAGYRDVFLRAAGLLEYGKNQNQVLDALRGGGFEAQAPVVAKKEREGILASVTGGLNQIHVEKVVPALKSTLNHRHKEFEREQREARLRQAEAWVQTIQHSTLQAVEESLAVNGGAGTIAVLEVARQHLLEEVVPELRDEALKSAKHAAGKSPTVDAILASVRGHIQSKDSRLAQAVEGPISRWIAESEEALSRLAAELLREFATDFLNSLTRALGRAVGDLDEQWGPTNGKASDLPRWADGTVTDDLLPAEFEVFLERPDEWRSVFDTLAKEDTGENFDSSALQKQIANVLQQDGWIRVTSPWSPTITTLPTERGQSRTAVAVSLKSSALREFCSRWLGRPNSPYQEYVREPLADWLAPSDGSEKVLSGTRLRDFLAGLSDVMRKASPLLSLDADVAARLFDDVGGGRPTRLFSPIPLDQGHPAYGEIRQLLAQDFRLTDQELDAVFNTEASSSEISIVTTLPGPVSPTVVSSLTSFILSDFDARSHQMSQANVAQDIWYARRARPLTQSLPVPPYLWRAILRGWWVGRALGCVDASEWSNPTLRDGSEVIPFRDHLGTRPRHPAHVLPWVLESMLLSALRLGHDEAAWRPYATLARWGAVSPHDNLVSESSEILSGWVHTGVGAGAGALVAGASAEERQANLRSWLDEVKSAYLTLDEYSPPKEWRPQDPAWEVASATVHALAQISSWTFQAGGPSGPPGLGGIRLPEV